MKFIVVLALVCAASAVRLSKEEVDQQFNLFKRQFDRQYNGLREESARRAIFEHNYKYIVNHNIRADNGVHSFRLGVNQFADLTNEEYNRQVNGYRAHSGHNSVQYNGESIDLPATVDWRTKGIVTPVKNQGQCGSCWAFSAVGSLEGLHALKTQKLVSLSEQNLVDCSSAEGNMGCGGGDMEEAFIYIQKNKGIDTEKAYPYEAADDSCRYKNTTRGAQITGYTQVAVGDESALKSAVAKIGTISVGIDASSMSFQFYTTGVYDDTECGNSPDDLDHGVTAVGYGTQDGKDYWLVKNSWDTTWGEKGYILMSRNSDNQCGIATEASFPIGVQ